MIVVRWLALIFVACMSLRPVAAEVLPDELLELSGLCRDAVLDEDAAAYVEVVERFRQASIEENSEAQREFEICILMVELIPAAKELLELPEESGRATEIETSGTEGDYAKLVEYQSRAANEAPDLSALVNDILRDEDFFPADGPEKEELEAALLAYVRPIPASQYEANLNAYLALARVSPENEEYVARAERYSNAIETRAEELRRAAARLENSLVRTTNAFDGSSWSRHPSSPRYQDTRNYITLYLIDDGNGRKSLELFVNYTSRNGWLFVNNAYVNIDGEQVRLPINRWLRDNDTEIWEFGSIRGPQAENLARRIADADRAVIRFNGQQFYDDHVVSNTDKRVMREMLEMWEVISTR